MRAKTYQIRWHWDSNTKTPMPVYSVDFHHNGGDTWRMATCGADNTIKTWKVTHKDEGTEVEFLSELARHLGTVNCVRFSPNGQKLASAGDDRTVIIWQLDDREGAGTTSALGAEDIGATEHWRTVAMMRQHREDIYDIAWSPDSKQLLSGSVDNTAILWDVDAGEERHQLKEHSHFVQGVAWDPLNRFVATQSSDRSVMVQALDALKKTGKVTSFEGGNTITARGLTSTPEKALGAVGEDGKRKRVTERLFVDENKSTFFRRLCFTPDGSLLITPAGRFTDAKGEEQNTLYIFRAVSPSVPVMRLSGLEASVVTVRCCPVLFKLKDLTANIFSGLKYRMIFAVATIDNVLLYDTQQGAPFAMLNNLHYAPLSDVAWAADGRILAISSEDGYVSIVSFKEGELGDASEDLAPLMDPEVLTKGAKEAHAALGTGAAPAALEAPAAAAAAAGTAVNILQPRRIAPTVVNVVQQEHQPTVNMLQPRRVAPTAVNVLQPRRVAPTAVNVLQPRKSSPVPPVAPVTASPAEVRPAKQRRVAPQLVSIAPRRVTPVLVSAADDTR